MNEDSNTTSSGTTRERPTTTSYSETVTTGPALNRTSYDVARQRDLDHSMLGSGTEPILRLFTTDDWRKYVDESVASKEMRTFLDETDFGSESVIGLEARVSGQSFRLILQSVSGVGTQSLQLRFEELETNGGLNVSPLHLILVRVPNRGIQPTEANAVIDWNADIETVSAKPSE
ncbi:hypothetical protein [Halorussus sp. MSC15.2]|uniref:hypothetical protein n=1 Tax=Halorussus sp. MSC15.2 TaxID=2283638 RepID=UPI0013D733C2|nr:hypothetical protein [Halorussus sp. MSC15.2]NEU59077.1 hypothetical protein [Halorussus sp. MSC15.2]